MKTIREFLKTHKFIDLKGMDLMEELTLPDDTVQINHKYFEWEELEDNEKDRKLITRPKYVKRWYGGKDINDDEHCIWIFPSFYVVEKLEITDLYGKTVKVTDLDAAILQVDNYMKMRGLHDKEPREYWEDMYNKLLKIKE